MAKIFKMGDPELAGWAATGRPADALVRGATVQAREIVESAQAEAVQLRAAAERERASTLAQAKDAGRQEGLALATELVARAHAVCERVRAAAAQEQLALAIAIARKVVGRELELNRSAVVEIAAQALAEVRDRREVVLRVNPGDAGELRSQQGRLQELLARARWLELREDDAVASGGVVVETEAGVVDAQLDAQLAALERVLKEGELDEPE
jgi:flagellar biosynthesis/type III secretory pathway protein FliH